MWRRFRQTFRVNASRLLPKGNARDLVTVCSQLGASQILRPARSNELGVAVLSLPESRDFATLREVVPSCGRPPSCVRPAEDFRPEWRGTPVVIENVRVQSFEVNKVPDDRFDVVPGKADVIEDLRGVFRVRKACLPMPADCLI